jgi:hypothetical protein
VSDFLDAVIKAMAGILIIISIMLVARQWHRQHQVCERIAIAHAFALGDICR